MGYKGRYSRGPPGLLAWLIMRSVYDKETGGKGGRWEGENNIKQNRVGRLSSSSEGRASVARSVLTVDASEKNGWRKNENENPMATSFPSGW